MAGAIMLGVPILGGLVGGTALQVGMRVAELDLLQRLTVELVLVVLGAAAIYTWPPGSAKDGKNWCTFLLCGSMVTTGGFAMAEGLIVNIVPGGAATALKLLGLLLISCLAYCL